MKKLCAVLLSLTLCLTSALALAQDQANDYTVGKTVIFGSYEQDNNLENGKEPISWIVLDTDGSKAMLISEYCLDARAYNTEFVRMTWAKCTLRPWLNDTFLQEAFSAEEQAQILETQVVNKDNPNYSTNGGEDTVDRVYLLSIAEVYHYFPDQTGRQGIPTAYAIARGAYYNEKTGRTWWWLRSPGVRPIDAEGVRADGRVSGYGSRDVYRPSGALRPVIWVQTAE